MLAKSHAGLGCVLIIALTLLSCDSKQTTQSVTQIIRPVKFIEVDAAGETEINQFPAVVGANRLSELSLQVGGLLSEFPVKEAQPVEYGDLIARLDPRDFESQVVSAKAQRINAEQAYQRALRLVEQDAIAVNVFEQRKTQLDISKAQLEQAEKALSDSVLRAPFKGVIAKTNVKKLQTIAAGQVVVSLMSEDSFKATIDLPASFIARIPKEASEDEQRQAFVLLDSAPNKPINAEFKEATLIADAASQTYAVTFTFPAPVNLNVLPGMNATVELRRNNKRNTPRVSVPLDAISSDGQDHYVWLIDKGTMTVSKQAVDIEQGVGATVVITEGLSVNNTIVGAGAAYLSEGMKIREWK